MTNSDLKALEMVRRIRDEQTAMLATMSKEAVLDYFRQAGEDAKADARRRAVKGTDDAGSSAHLQRTGSGRN